MRGLAALGATVLLLLALDAGVAAAAADRRHGRHGREGTTRGMLRAGRRHRRAERLRRQRRKRTQEQPESAEPQPAAASEAGAALEGVGKDASAALNDVGGASVAHFVPGRIVIAGNKRCVNRCAATKGCRAFTAAAPERRDQCVLSCHRECSVCPLSAVTQDCGRACVSQCESTGASENDPLARQACHHACLESCPCEDLGPQLFDLIDKIPDFVVEVAAGDDDESGAGSEAGGHGGHVLGGSAMSGVAIGIDAKATSDILQAAMKDPAAKAALLAGIRSEESESAGVAAMSMSQNNSDTSVGLAASLAQAKLEGDHEKASKLERQSEEMKDAAEEQLRDGRLAAEGAAAVSKLSQDAMRGAVEASKLQDAAAASTAAGDASGGQDLADQAKALVAEGEAKACKAAKETSKELEIKVSTLDELAAGLYEERERAAKGTSPETAKVASEDYEKAAAKAYAAGQALAAMKAKVVEACGDGSPKEAKESREIQIKSKDLMAESAALKAQAEKYAAAEAEAGAVGDGGAAVNRTMAEAADLEDKAAEADLESSALALEAEDKLKAEADEHLQDKAKALAESVETSSQENNPELSKMLHNKAAELNETLYGDKNDDADNARKAAADDRRGALDAINTARSARHDSPGSEKAEELTSAAKAKVARAKKSLEAARQASADSSPEEPEDSGEEDGTRSEDDIRRKIDEAAAAGDSEVVEKYERLLAQFKNATASAEMAVAVANTEKGGATGGAEGAAAGPGSETGPGETESKYRIMYAKMLRGENTTTDEVEATIAEIEGVKSLSSEDERAQQEEEVLLGATGTADSNGTVESENATQVGNETTVENEEKELGDDDISQVMGRRDLARLHRIETQTKYKDFLGVGDASDGAETEDDSATGGSGSGAEDVGVSARFKNSDSPYATFVDASG